MPVDVRYRAVQVELVYSQLAFGSLGAIAGALFVVFFLGSEVSRLVSVFWLAAIVVTTGIIPNVFGYLFRKADSGSREGDAMATRLVAVCALAGITWGSAGVFMYVPGDLLPQFLLMFLLFVGSAAMAGLTSPYSPAFYATVGLSLAPFGIRCAIDGDATHLGMALMAPVYFSVLVSTQMNIHKTILESIRLRFENTALLHEANKERALSELANEAKSRFLAAASHDLRQPLHAQGLFLEELRAQPLDQDARRLLDRIGTCADTLRALLDALLDISKLDAGTVKCLPCSFPVQRILDQLKMVFEPVAVSRGISLRVMPCSAVIFSDEVLLARILRNLLDNAVNYTHEGRILVGCRRRKGQLYIQLWDTGTGIDSSELDNIFNEFYQINNPERDRSKGLGLGLAIVDRLCSLLDCDLQVESSLGRGSVFSIQVPMGDRGALSTVPIDVSSLQNADVSGATVLIIEDERDVREGTRSLLESWGCTVLAVASESDAIEVIKTARNGPDVIIADYRLRDGATGIDAINAVQTVLERKLPGLLVSGDTHPDRLREARSSGYTLLHKPAPAHKLRAFISYHWRL